MFRQALASSHLDTTPTLPQRRARLDSAHAGLLAAEPATATVTTIAMRWGSAHPGQFAARYRDACPSSPAGTHTAPPDAVCGW